MRRKFNFSDEILLGWGDKVVGYLQNDLPAFTAFDANINGDYQQRITTLVNKALQEGGDEVNVARLGEKNEVVLDLLDQCRLYYKKNPLLGVADICRKKSNTKAIWYWQV